MALFGSKKNTETTEKLIVSKKSVKSVATVSAKKSDTNSSTHTPQHQLHAIIKRPRITEKASLTSEKGIYAFEVSPRSTKVTIAAAIKELYNVSPVKVNIVTVPTKEVIIRNKKGIKGGGKKAYVYLKKGETIEFV